MLAVVGEAVVVECNCSSDNYEINPARIKEGSIDLCGKDIVAMSEKEMQEIRGQLVSTDFPRSNDSFKPDNEKSKNS